MGVAAVGGRLPSGFGCELAARDLGATRRVLAMAEGEVGVHGQGEEGGWDGNEEVV